MGGTWFRRGAARPPKKLREKSRVPLSDPLPRKASTGTLTMLLRGVMESKKSRIPNEKSRNRCNNLSTTRRKSKEKRGQIASIVDYCADFELVRFLAAGTSLVAEWKPLLRSGMRAMSNARVFATACRPCCGSESDPGVCGAFVTGFDGTCNGRFS